MRKLFFLALNLLLLPLGSGAQETVSFKLTPPGGKLRLADTFTVKVEAALPQKYSLRPDTASADTSDFELVSFTKTGETLKDGLKTDLFEIKAQAFALGVSTFPEVTWELYESSAAAAQAKSPSFQLTVLPLFETKKDEGIRDIYPPLSFIPWLWVFLGAAAAAAAGYLLYRRFFRPKAAAFFAASLWSDRRSPYQRARDRLDKLETSPLLKKELLKEFYIGLTSILRFYLREEFSIDAELMTTTDLARELKNTGTDIKTTLKAREFLQKADLVKFAKMKPEDAAADISALKDMLMEFTRTREAQKEKERAAAAEAAVKKK